MDEKIEKISAHTQMCVNYRAQKVRGKRESGDTKNQYKLRMYVVLLYGSLQNWYGYSNKQERASRYFWPLPSHAINKNCQKAA